MIEDLDELRTFCRIAELGSLVQAARRLGVGQPAISKRLRTLEQRLGARLVLRSTTGASLTAAGRRFYERIAPVLEALDAAAEEARHASRGLEGQLSVHVPVGLGELHLTRVLAAFRARYPRISLDVVYDDRAVDLVAEGTDIAFRIGAITAPDLVVRQLALLPRLLVASPAYLRAGGRLREPTDLERHEFVRYSRLQQGRLLTLERDGARRTVQMRSSFLVNNSVAVRELVLAGVGIAMVPRWLVHDDLVNGRLAPVLPAWTTTAAPLHAVYPSATLKPKRVSALVDFVHGALADIPGIAVC